MQISREVANRRRWMEPIMQSEAEQPITIYCRSRDRGPYIKNLGVVGHFGFDS